MGTAHPHINFTNLWNSSRPRPFVIMSASWSSDAIHWIDMRSLLSSMNWLKCQCLTLMCLVLGRSRNSLFSAWSSAFQLLFVFIRSWIVFFPTCVWHPLLDHRYVHGHASYLLLQEAHHHPLLFLPRVIMSFLGVIGVSPVCKWVIHEWFYFWISTVTATNFFGYMKILRQ